MDTLHDDLSVFLIDRMSGFVEREVQQQMTRLVAEAVRDRKNAMIEAGTGTGKTYAYLLPILSSGKKVIISTGTKNLQDQLYQHDLPFINQFFSRSTALLKGRANYLCLDRLYKNIEKVDLRRETPTQEKLMSVYAWAEHTKTGDLTETLDEEDLGQLQGLVTSTSDNCLGQDCKYVGECYLYRARQVALEADVVVVNHHLFFADLALKEDDLGALLPAADLIVLDEAHQVEDVARNFYGEHLGSGQLQSLAADVIREQELVGRDDPTLIETAQTLGRCVDSLVSLIVKKQSTSMDALFALDREVEEVDLCLAELISRLALVEQRSVGLSRCYARAGRISDMFALLTEKNTDADSAHWLETRLKGFTIHLMPLNIAEHLRPLLTDGEKVWLLVSATLATTAKYLEAGTAQDYTQNTQEGGGVFKHIQEALGFDDGLSARFSSPFDFPHQVAAYIPSRLPAANDSRHTASLIASVLPLIRTHSGRSLLLFTSHKALSEAARCMQDEHDIAFMVQGALAKAKLIARFRATEGAVLLATHSFWEGVDLGGSNLKLLVIDKLPFTSPDDPVFQAQSERIDAEGGNSFMNLSLPKAAITLKQGFGRLIRSESDRGLFVLGDHRLVQKPYGKILKRSLPSVDWLADAQAAITYLEKL